MKLDNGGEIQISGIFKDFRMRNILNPIGPTIIEVIERNDYPWSAVIKIKGDEEEAWKQIIKTYDKVTDGYGQSLAELIETPFIEQKIQKAFRAEDQLLKIVAIFAFCCNYHIISWFNCHEFILRKPSQKGNRYQKGLWSDKQ